MSGTIAGGAKTAATNKRKYGEDYYKLLGTKGGAVGTTGGFYVNRELAKTAGAKGGRIGRRGKTIDYQNVLTARLMYASGETMADIARQLNIGYSSVRYIVGRK